MQPNTCISLPVFSGLYKLNMWSAELSDGTIIIYWYIHVYVSIQQDFSSFFHVLNNESASVPNLFT